ncbi:DDB1- and CUL4-associated factor 8 [Parasteatoda tepidariorum]|uniref:DDB1- and CUL4-associated factor 8 n=1 Tax=Parasteatoda tepidariorum TaxID=114398 RepID=UPI0039BC6BC4
MASSSKSSGKSKRSPQVESSENDCLGSSSDQECSMKGKRMKKDDSGINVIQENETSDESDIENFSDIEKKLGQNSPDSGNNEPCNFPNVHQQGEELEAVSASVNEATASCSSQSPLEKKSKNDTSGSSDDKNLSMRLSHRSSSDSDSENSSEKTDSNCDSDHTYGKVGKAKPADQSDKDYDPTPSTPRPKYNWNAPLALTSRQYGHRLNYSPDLFRYKCYGSLHMVERLELMDKMKRHDGCVNALNFNSTGTKLASGSDDLDIVVWDWTIGEPLFDYNSGHRSNVFQAKFMPLSQDGFIVSCGRDGQVRVGEISSSGECKKTRKLAQHKGAAHKLALQMDSPNTFYSCGEDAAVFQVDLRKEKPDRLVLCKAKEKKVPQKNVTSVVYNYNGQEVLASYNDEDIYSFDNLETVQNKYLHRYRGHRNSQTVKGVNYFGPKSEFVMSGSDCGYIFFWEKETEHIVKYMYGDEGGVVNCLEPNPIMPVLATSGLDDDIKIWVPSCETPPDLSGLRKHLIANMKEREEERRDCPEAFIDQTIWFLMQHLARSRGRRASGRDDPVIEISSSDSDSQDEDVEIRREIQCNQS